MVSYGALVGRQGPARRRQKLSTIAMFQWAFRDLALHVFDSGRAAMSGGSGRYVERDAATRQKPRSSF